MKLMLPILIALPMPLALACGRPLMEAGDERAYSQHIAAERYVSLAGKALSQVLGNDGAVVITPIGAYHALTVPAGAVELRARVPSVILRSRMLAWIDVQVDGRLRVPVPVKFEVRNFRPALVTTRRVQAKAALLAEQVELRRVDVAVLGGEAVADPGLLAGKRLRRDLAAEAVVTADVLEERPPIELGERIDVYARVGRVVVRTVGIAEQDGFVGSRIGVKVVKSGRRLQAWIAPDKRVWVNEDVNSKIL